MFHMTIRVISVLNMLSRDTSPEKLFPIEGAVIDMPPYGSEEKIVFRICQHG